MSASETQRPVVAGLGELLWDCFEDVRRPGGAPANVAFHAGQLGCRGVVCSRLGTDALGDDLCDFLTEQGLETTWIQRDPERPTGTVTVELTGGYPQFTIHENVAWDALAFDKSLQELMQQAAAVCFGTLAQRSQTSRETLHRCLGAAGESCLKVYDVNLRQRWYERDRVERSLQQADIVKLNHEEVRVLAELLGTGTAGDVDFAGTIRKRFAVAIVCVTRAEHGCLLVGDEDPVDVPGLQVNVRDAVGAGDAFTAALIAGRLRGWPLAATARFANEVGALVASRDGAMPPLREEFRRLAEKHGQILET